MFEVVTKRKGSKFMKSSIGNTKFDALFPDITQILPTSSIQMYGGQLKEFVSGYHLLGVRFVNRCTDQVF